jgi:RNA polymerase sigma-70 factor (ECF subfamily)
VESVKHTSENDQFSSPDSGLEKTENIFAEYGEFILSVIQAKVQDTEVVDDLFQDFFLSLVRRPLPDDLKNIKAYLYRSIINDIIDYTRRTKYKKLETSYDELQCNITTNASAEKDMSNKEQAGKIYDLIDRKLPSSESTAVRLRYKENQNISEIAEHMNITKRSVARYVSSGLRTIREYVIDQEDYYYDR